MIALVILGVVGVAAAIVTAGLRGEECEAPGCRRRFTFWHNKAQLHLCRRHCWEADERT